MIMLIAVVVRSILLLQCFPSLSYSVSKEIYHPSQGEAKTHSEMNYFNELCTIGILCIYNRHDAIT